MSGISTLHLSFQRLDLPRRHPARGELPVAGKLGLMLRSPLHNKSKRSRGQVPGQQPQRRDFDHRAMMIPKSRDTSGIGQPQFSAHTRVFRRWFAPANYVPGLYTAAVQVNRPRPVSTRAEPDLSGFDLA